MTEIDRNTILVSLVVAFGVMLVAGLTVIPTIHEAQASNSISDSRNKGQL